LVAMQQIRRDHDQRSWLDRVVSKRVGPFRHPAQRRDRRMKRPAWGKVPCCSAAPIRL
jgi:hypothetical protein